MKLSARAPRISQSIARDKRRHKKALYEAARLATHETSIGAQRKVRGKISQVGLGKLANAVGQTSAKKKGQRPEKPYGAIYAKGGDESRAGQALKSYTKGAVITARKGKWLAFATRNIPARAGRWKMTPERYNKGGFQTRIGKLQFVQINANTAWLVVRNVTLHPRTHQAKRQGPGRTRTRIPKKQIVAFVLIRVTRRAIRFNKDREVWKAARETPERIKWHHDRLLAKG